MVDDRNENLLNYWFKICQLRREIRKIQILEIKDSKIKDLRLQTFPTPVGVRWIQFAGGWGGGMVQRKARVSSFATPQGGGRGQSIEGVGEGGIT